MASASSLLKGQIPVGCQLCEAGSKIQWKCCDCYVLMCIKCKEKVHSKFKNGNNHRIIETKELGTQDSEETITFSDVHCKQHVNQPCCLFCKTCKELVCLKCITKTHNGHSLVDEEEYEIKRKKIKDNKTKIKMNLKKFTQIKEDFNKVKDSEFLKYNKSKEDILAQTGTVEKLVEELLNELDDKWKQLSQDLGGKQNEVQKIEKELFEQNTTIDELIQSNDLVTFFEETDKIKLSLDRNIHINTEYNSVPMFVPAKLTKDNIGTLKIVKQETKKEFKVIRHFTSELRGIHCAAVCSDGSLWIGDNIFTLLHVQIKGNNIEKLLRLNTFLKDIAITPKNKLLICSIISTVIQVSRTGEMKDAPYSVKPLNTMAVHLTKNNKVIIGAMIPGDPWPPSRSCVVVLDRKGKHLIEYELDRNNKWLFVYPARITSTSEGNLLVVDVLDKLRGRVVVLGPNGDVITIYNGHSDINKMSPFSPTDIITTALNNIVVVDGSNYLIHILDSEGHFITYYNTNDFGIIYPFSLALSKTGKLYIGCVAPQLSPDTYRSKLYEVEFSGF